MESLFFIDIIMCFCQEYLDEETYSVVSELKLIAKHYLMRSFIFDFLAWIPFDLIIDINEENEKVRLLRIFKLLRLPRLMELLNVERVKQIVTNHYN